MPRPFLVPLVAWSLLLGLGAAAPAQEDREPRGFVDVVDVEVVEVDVQVTDRDGRPITGLTAEDFTVFEDGKAVVVTNFREVATVAAPADTKAAGEPPAVSPPAAEPTPGTTVEPAPEPRPAHLVIYVDNANIRSTHRHRVLRDLRRFLYDLQQPFRTMVVSFDRGLNLRQRFTERPGEVIQSLLALEDEAVHGDTSHDEFRDLVREIEAPESPQSWLENRVRGYAQNVEHELERSLEALSDVCDSLAGLPGRKALLYVSDGLPLTPAEELFHALEHRYDDLTVLHNAMLFNASQQIERLAQRANTAAVTFYSLHAGGLEAPMASEAEVAGWGIEGLRATVDSVRLANFQSSGRMLAAATGGAAMLNQNDYRLGLERMVEDLRHYYSLGYRPRSPGDGRYHKIEVELADRKLQVRHRRGYRDRTLSQRMEAMVRSAVSYGAGDNPLDLDVEVVTAAAGGSKGGDTDVIVARVGIPMGRLVLVPQGEWYVSRTLLFLAVRDAAGDTSPVQEVEVPIRIPAVRIDAALEQRWFQEVSLRVRPGPQLLVVGLWDELGRDSSVAFQRFQVGR